MLRIYTLSFSLFYTRVLGVRTENILLTQPRILVSAPIPLHILLKKIYIAHIFSQLIKTKRDSRLIACLFSCCSAEITQAVFHSERIKVLEDSFVVSTDAVLWITTVDLVITLGCIYSTSMCLENMFSCNPEPIMVRD